MSGTTSNNKNTLLKSNMREPLGRNTSDVYTIPPVVNIFSLEPGKRGKKTKNSPDSILHSEGYHEPNSITTLDHSPIHL